MVFSFKNLSLFALGGFFLSLKMLTHPVADIKLFIADCFVLFENSAASLKQF